MKATFGVALLAIVSGQTWSQGVVCETWTWSEEAVAALIQDQGRAVDAVVEVLVDSLWSEVEVLHEDQSWVPCEEGCLRAMEGRLRSRVRRSVTWRIQAVPGGALLTGRIPVLRWGNHGWERLESLRADLGASPLGVSRVTRVWPESSVLSEGEWYMVATTEEGVHCLGYDELLALGIDPAAVDPSALRLHGSGGRALPMVNDAERPLDVPQQAVVARGLDDGSFDVGDGLCWFAPSHEEWTWNESDGWVHRAQPWADTAKWFLRVDSPLSHPALEVEPLTGTEGPVVETRTTHTHRAVWELHSVNLIKSGRNWFGPRLSSLGATTYAWNIPVAHAVEGVEGRVNFAACSRTVGTGTGSQLQYVWNGQELNFADGVLTSSSLNYASYFEGSLTAVMDQPAVQLLANFTPGTSESDVWLDYVTYQIQQQLVFDGVQQGVNGLPVDGSAPDECARYVMGGSVQPDAVWDVSNPLDVRDVMASAQPEGWTWKAPVDTVRRFWAFRWSAALRPTPLGSITPSNLQSLPNTELVIVTVPGLKAPADSLASLHRLQGMTAEVVLQRDVFQAFSSGQPDPTAIKMLMMMLRDRWVQGGSVGPEPRYLLLLGDATYENRNLPADGMNIVGHYSEESLSTTRSYISDDYYALTAEGQGERPEDKLQFGVGRIPASNAEDAWAVVEKIATYLGFDESDDLAANCLDPNGSSVFGPWRNRLLFVSDDQDGNNQDGHRYMENSEEHSNHIREFHNEYDVLKIYPDAYVQTNTPGGERYDDATAEIARRVDEGALIVNYIGHGGERGWAHERILNLETIQGWRNVRRLPVFMTATCELFRYDDPDISSAGEEILMNPLGGGVALLTTTRTVYSGGNQQINRAFYETALIDEPGRCLGDIYADTKNSPVVTAAVNSRNFSLMGDPALRLAYPKERVVLTEFPDTLKSLERVTMQGFVADASGDTLHSFQGVVTPTVFDKRAKVITLDNDASEGPFEYDVFQNILHRGMATVENGTFSFEFIVPRDIDYAYGPGRVSLYALGGGVDAHGYTEAFTLGGTSDDPIDDDEGPLVSLYINDTLFQAGDVVHEDPWLVARVFDESGINTSGTGIGHDAKAILDGDVGNPIVLNDSFTSDLDTYKSGTIRFPFTDLEDGMHELTVKVWDVANNSATESTHFVVASSLEVALLEVLAYPNPATDHVAFRVTGNQACRPADVSLQVFDVRGGLVYEDFFAGEVLGFRDDVFQWDLKPSRGSAVPPGVYVFRVTWQNETGDAAQYADKLVVVRP